MDQRQFDAKETIKSCIQNGQLSEAEALLATWRKTYGQDERYYLLGAIVALERKQYPEAEERLFAALAQAPERFEVLYLLGNLYEQMADFPYALEWYRKARLVANANQLAQIDAVPQRIPGVEPGLSMGKRKLTLFVRAGFDQFLDDLIGGLNRHYDVTKAVISRIEEVAPLMEQADICWFEWCDELVVHASRLEVARRKPIVCRLHRYEVFTPMPAQVQWENIDTLMLVTDHLITILRSTVPGIEDRVQVAVVCNGVAIDRYRFTPRSPGFNLASVGYIHSRKNPTLLLQILAKLVRFDARYKLYVAGQFQEPMVQIYWNHMIKEMGLANNVQFDGWQKDIGGWLSDKQFLLSTSMHESFGYSIAEAMACGIKPVVHNFPFSGGIWPEQVLFNTVDEAVGMVTSHIYSSKAYRDFIEQHYSLFQQITETRKVLSALPMEKRSDRKAALFQKGALRETLAQLIPTETTG
ncbi:MAG: glycosyltransferase [Rhodothermales bacterium]|nr:glycosyltransferase [Rhodothermales bacterium]